MMFGHPVMQHVPRAVFCVEAGLKFTLSAFVNRLSTIIKIITKLNLHLGLKVVEVIIT